MRGREFAQWQAFHTVAAFGSFSKAAETLGMSASSVSQVVRELEARVGLRLLNRTTRSVAVTEAGARMRTRLDHVFAQLDAMREDTEDLLGEPSGTVRLLVPRQAYVDWVAPALPAFAKAHPRVVLDITVDDRTVDLTRDGFDLGVRLGELLEDDMVAFPLGGPLRQVVAATPAYFATHGVPAHPRDLHTHACIGWRQAGSLAPYAWEFEKRGRSLAVAVEGPLVLNDRTLCLDAALAGMGMVFWVEHRLRPHVDAKRLKLVLEDWCPSFPGFHVYYPKHRQESPALGAVIAHLRAAASASAAPKAHGTMRGSVTRKKMP